MVQHDNIRDDGAACESMIGARTTRQIPRFQGSSTLPLHPRTNMA